MKTIKFIIFITAITIVLSTNVFAQESMALSVFPAVQDIKINPGEKTRTQIQFRNGSDSLVTGNVKVADFIVTDKKGTVELFEDQFLKPKYSASSWIKLSDDFVAIPKNEIVTINLSITAPPELTSCGYYALVYFQPDTAKVKKLGRGERETASSITSKLGGLINFSVENKTCVENVSISRLDGPIFLEYGPVNVSFDLLNLGDIHATPKGTVMLTNMFGQYVDQQPLRELRIFPEKAKEYQASLGQKWMLGKYKVNVMVSYGNSPKTIEKIIYIWVFPWRVALAVTLTIIILFLIISSLYKNIVVKETNLEGELKKEQEEIEKLKTQLRKRT